MLRGWGIIAIETGTYVALIAKNDLELLTFITFPCSYHARESNPGFMCMLGMHSTNRATPPAQRWFTEALLFRGENPELRLITEYRYHLIGKAAHAL